MKKNTDLGLLLIRFSIGFPMLFYGISKLIYGIDFIMQLVVNVGLPQLFGYGVYIGEILAPILLLIGFRTRIAGIVFSINCVTAILLAQTDSFLKLNASGGWALELLFIYSIVSLALTFTGGGKHSVSNSAKWD
ncbi:DoxX family protein [Owenweeksia hongkongensis]|uniref:DoxX family protein n=1 Tax=Owenweeksia hongkongensis TaxID=253245 RepID=UPI003A900388